MGKQGAVVGAGLLGVLALAGIVSVFATYTPVGIMVIIVALGLITLGALGVWVAGRSRQLAMRVAIAATVVAALLGIPPMLFISEVPTGQRVFHALFLVVTVVAIVLVKGELTSGSRRAPSKARAA